MASQLPRAKIVERVDLTNDLMIIKVKPDIPLTFKPGQYCTIGLKGVERPYSIVSSPHEQSLELFVELVPEGELTPKLWQVTVGEVLSIRPSAKGVFFFDDKYPNQFMVATVTGIAPFMSMIRNYLHRALSSHTFYVLQGASYQDEFAYKHELESLSKEHENIIYTPTVSRPEEERNKGWRGETGRVNVIVERYLEKFPLDPESTLVYACGHPGMIEDVKQRLGGKGYKVKEEKFWRE
ncbi:MAG TPA: FAD-binding oxidoreductase [Thermodesulfobacteriota bacterium]|nr:FAD-binding oxidoreductase [Thermodesulfobacteriota bacterium]